MYTNEDLHKATQAGIFAQDDVDKFYLFMEDERHSSLVDEENFKLISGFNDIFVVIASILLLSSAAWVSSSVGKGFSMLVVAGLSWGLAEFFVRKRRMSLPAIVLLVSYVTSIFFFVISFWENPFEISFGIAAAITGIATWIHWKRFAVPITVAAGMATLAVFLVSLVLSIDDSPEDYASILIFLTGLITFGVAMYWDASDVKRLTHKSDVAFWLHLLASPLIVHPIFSSLGIFDNQSGMGSIVIIVLLYLLLSSISLIVDRRAFMVSSLIYVLFALNQLFKTYGLESNSFAIGGMFIGFSLLLLTGYWSQARNFLLRLMPQSIHSKVPKSHS